MSYDYMLARVSGIADAEEFIEAASLQPIGPAEPLIAAISALFPSVSWQRSVTQTGRGDAVTTWMGQGGPPQFLLMLGQDDEVVLFSMSRCERADVARVARALELSALDEQSLEVFAG